MLEYRLNFVDITNHPLTHRYARPGAGPPTARADICSGEQCLLWRFTAPRKGGQFVAGKGEVEIGVGAYNCDGTYSFYGPTAAPDRSAEIGESDPGRWQSVKVPADVDPAKQGIERYPHPVCDATGTARSPAASSSGRRTTRSTGSWRAPASRSPSSTPSEAGQDCMGERDGFGWSTVAGFVSYSPLKGNEKDISNLISQTYCSLLAFGLLPEGKKNTDCLTTARCMPGTRATARWVKLPGRAVPRRPKPSARSSAATSARRATPTARWAIPRR